MPGCCTKGTDSDAELLARNAPRAPPRLPPANNDGGREGATVIPVKDGTDGDEDTDALSNGKNINGAGEGGDNPAPNDDDNDDDDDDLPMVIEAKVEDDEEASDEADDRRDAQWKICLTLFLLVMTLIFLVLFFVIFLGSDTNDGATVYTAITPPLVLPPTGACRSNPCQHFGACFANPDHPSKYFCTCRTGFSGRDCSKRDPCRPKDPCGPKGRCIKDDENESFTCLCQAGFTGNRCEIVDDKKIDRSSDDDSAFVAMTQ